MGVIDVVLPLLHGPYGEDGTIQGLFEMSDVRYVGCGVTSSSASMDKHLTKTVLAEAGISVGRWELVTEKQWSKDPQDVRSRIDALGYPVFVKPTRAGSSVGISRVDSPDQLDLAIKEAAANDPPVARQWLRPWVRLGFPKGSSTTTHSSTSTPMRSP